MRERPILFSGPLVRAILEGRKTQTRRVVTPQPKEIRRPIDGGVNLEFYAKSGRVLGSTPVDLEQYPVGWFSPYGQPGDRLWVQEAFRLTEGFDGDSPASAYRIFMPFVAYEASIGSANPWGRLRPSIHMPRWASRIDLEVTGVRVERAKDITEADAEREGVELPTDHEPGREPTYRHHFAKLWDDTNGKREGCSWADNPWVWVVEFRRVRP